MWLLLALSAAIAQDEAPTRFNGQVLRPSADSSATLWSDGSATAPDGYATARVYAHYANAPVRTRGVDGDVEALVTNLVELDLLGAWHWRGLRLAAHVPLYGLAAGAGVAGRPGIGDVAVDLKATVFDAERDPFGAALLGRLLLPTASVNVDLPLGNQGTGWELIGIVDREFDPVTIVANVGVRDVPRAVVRDIVWNEQIFARVGAGYAISDDVGASLEVSAQTNWASNVNPAGTAAEALLGGWGRLGGPFVLRGGVSVGLSRSPGAPLVRGLLGVSWEPDPFPDKDLDGLVDREDGCPDVGEDPDGFEDFDGCPDPAFTTRIDVVGPDGEPLEALIVMDGPDSRRLGEGESVVTMHPGRYRVVAQVDGYEPWAGELDIGSEQRIKIPVVPRVGTLRVWAVDADGKRLPATVQVDDGRPVPADGEPMELRVGEHALVITAPGYRAEATSIDILNGQQRAKSVVLERAESTP